MHCEALFQRPELEGPHACEEKRGESGQGFGDINESKAGDGFEQRLGLWVHITGSKLLDLLVHSTQTRFQWRRDLADCSQSRSTRLGNSGSAMELAARV